MVRKKSPAGAKQPNKKSELRELIVTLIASNGEIAKIEELVSAGKRRAISETELATLAGDDIAEELCQVFEAAYVAGVRDGLDEVLGDDIPADDPHPRSASREIAGKEILRSGIRRIIMRRAARRGLERVRQTTAPNGAQEAR